MMTSAQKRKWTLLFAISMVGLILFLVFKPEWCWVMFPPVGTTAILALDMI